jgi:hypothetical protein
VHTLRYNRDSSGGDVRTSRVVLESPSLIHHQQLKGTADAPPPTPYHIMLTV